MANRPIKIRKGKIKNLLSLYHSTYKKIVQEIKQETVATQINRVAVLARINRELEDLSRETQDWTREEIPQYYLDGANVAIQDLRDLGVDVATGEAIAAINRLAIQSLVDGTLDSFAESIRGISRSSRLVIDDAFRQQLNFIIAQGRLTGEARRTISNAITEQLRDQGLIALTDKAGRVWEFDRYAEMLVRTKVVEARNQGMANKMLQNGYDLVQVTDTGSSHPACAKWEGKILSLTGQTTGELRGGYSVAGTLEEAKSQGLFHPNCEHAINVLVPRLAERTKAYNADNRI